MTTATAISMEEYLNTSYEWEPEYVDGELIERPMATRDHARVQQNISVAIDGHPNERLTCEPGVRLTIGPKRLRIPDLSIFFDDEADESYPSRPPIAVVEILSPDDRYAVLSDKFNDYKALGIRYSWLVDPERKTIQRIDGANWVHVDSIEISEHGLLIPAAEIFARRRGAAKK